MHPIPPKSQSSNPSSQSDINHVQVFKDVSEDDGKFNSIDSISSSSEGDESPKIQLRRSRRYGLRTNIAKSEEPGSKDKPMDI